MHFLVFLILGLLVPSTISIKVQLSTGTIEGKELNATYSPFGNQSSLVFFGIPYVEPPLGDLRFRKPRPPIPWDGILETKAYKPACMSNATKTYKNGIGGPISEDCLYANVFTNKYCMKNKNCSVMIAIHGGGFLFESASAFNPEILINNFVGQNRNIVVVSINYRVGVFGFGHLAGDQGDRNMGLFDIMAGVKWVRKEINNFGGIKDRITLAGHSAGAGLIVAFSNSPLTKGLIHQQIIMSGPLPNVSKKSNYKGFTRMAQIVKCLPEDSGFGVLSKKQVHDTYSCLREKSSQELLDAEMYVLMNTTYYFGAPHIDGQFIVDYPDRLFAAKSVFPINTLIGTTTAELRETIYITDPKNADLKEALLKNMCEHIGYEIYTEKEKFVDNCFTYYSNGTQAQFLSDDMEFYSRAISVASIHVSNNTKVYMYSYAYSGAGRAFNKYLDVPSPHHSEDLIYIFGTHRGVFAPKDYVIEQIYSGVFADFVNFEDPSPSENQKWLQYTPEKREHFVIDFDQNFTMPGMRENYYAEALKFWSGAGKKTFSEQYSPSYDTFIITNLVSPIVSHLNNVSSDVDKTLEQTEKLFFERENYLEKLKLERKFELEGKKRGNSEKWKGKKTAARMGNEIGIQERDGGAEEAGGGGGINILLIIFAGTLLGGILYVTISHFCLHHRSREGYQLLK
uniref:Carboxylic ester hydrolase n=1 Tax=Caenorhabditis tropicalis TaxID=1561998 RepID=A0A1I7UW97_9PELO